MTRAISTPRRKRRRVRSSPLAAFLIYGGLIAGSVFAGSSGNFMAFDAKSGKNLWHYQTGSALYAGATTYMLDGRQYVLMPSGTTLTAFALADVIPAGGR